MPESLSWTGGTGQLLAIDSVTSGTEVWIQLLTGSAPAAASTITGNGGGSATTGAVTSRTLSNVFSGVSTGTSIIGAYGLGIEATDLTASDKLFDLANVEVVPPNNVTFSVSGLVAGQDRVLVGPETGGALNKSQLTLLTTLVAAETVAVMNAAIPSDTPASGTIRIVNDGGYDRFIESSSFTHR